MPLLGTGLILYCLNRAVLVPLLDTGPISYCRNRAVLAMVPVLGTGPILGLSKPRCYVSGLAFGWNRRACRTPGTGPKQRHGHGSGMPGPCVLGKPARCQRHMRVGDVHRTTANQISFALHRPSMLRACDHVLFNTRMFLHWHRSD